MNTAGKVITVAAVGGAGYLTYDYFASRGSAGASGVPLISSAVSTVRSALPASIGGATARKVATPYPSMQAIPYMITQGAPGNTNVFGLSRLSDEINGIGSGKIISALASCETTTNAGRLACYNCNLFNMRISASDLAAGKKFYMVGDKKCRDFLTGETSQKEGFISCLIAFSEWMGSHCNSAREPMHRGQFNEFTIEWANAWGETIFKRDIVNGTVAHSTLKARYDLLVSQNKADALT